MSQPKPQVALILLRAEWFDAVVALPELVQAVQQDAEQIERCVSERLVVSHTWVVNSLSSLQAAEAGIRLAQVDLFVLVFQVWSEDFYLRPLLEAVAGRPLAAWCFLPWRRLPQKVPFVQVLRGSGPVGALESLGTLRNLGVSFSYTFGAADDPRALGDLEIAARAAQVRRKLRSARASDCCRRATSRCRALLWMNSACITSWVQLWNIFQRASWSALLRICPRLNSKPFYTTCARATRSTVSHRRL